MSSAISLLLAFVLTVAGMAVATNTAVSKLPKPSETMRAAIVGVSGSGKGNAAKAYLVVCTKAGMRIIAWDPLDEYSQKGKKSKHVHLGCLRDRCTFEELADNPSRWLDVEDLSLAVVPSDDDDVAAEEFADFVELIRPTGNMLVVVDELGGFAFGNAKATIAQKALNTLATKGRHDGICCLFVSQRLVHIPTSARASVTAIETFNQTSPQDLAALEEITGMPELALVVSKQKAGESTAWVSPMLEAA